MIDTLFLLFFVGNDKSVSSEIENGKGVAPVSQSFPNLCPFFFLSSSNSNNKQWPFLSSGGSLSPPDILRAWLTTTPFPYRKPISLISHSDVRYRGILAGIDPAASTIQLSNGMDPICP